MKWFSRKWLLVMVVLFVCILGLSLQAAAEDKVLQMATTTSTDNTGLLDYLAPTFKADTGIELRWVAVGTGKALELGKNCDVDVLFVHAPAAERKYVEAGSGTDRRQIMYNDFIFIGPKADPAGIKGASVQEALKKIATKGASFASRGDNSGTHKMEIDLWKAAGLAVPDKESWYIQTGQGMINTINIAAERDAYTLTDRGTFIKYEANWKGNSPLVILVEGDEALRNQYSVISVNPEKCKNVRYEYAQAFAHWITSKKAQKMIAEFKLIGKQLFTPNAATK
ncbi:MAG: substrate-binding domain-containing protein [Syntrophales bacterium]|jgi:tungstate transport system substrate-binding protein|nr:substrate-binding domain-containing protein [Syntrophales bacterium]MDY0044977.1 substrate-binding domain-containing protein [Syntrophales bacterium]